MERLYAEIWDGEWEYDLEFTLKTPYPLGMRGSRKGNIISYGVDPLRELHVLAIL